MNLIGVKVLLHVFLTFSKISMQITFNFWKTSMKREADWFDFFYFPRYINQCEKISRRVWSWLRM